MCVCVCVCVCVRARVCVSQTSHASTQSRRDAWACHGRRNACTCDGVSRLCHHAGTQRYSAGVEPMPTLSSLPFLTIEFLENPTSLIQRDVFERDLFEREIRQLTLRNRSCDISDGLLDHFTSICTCDCRATYFSTHLSRPVRHGMRRQRSMMLVKGCTEDRALT